MESDAGAGLAAGGLASAYSAIGRIGMPVLPMNRGTAKKLGGRGAAVFPREVFPPWRHSCQELDSYMRNITGLLPRWGLS
jgi:hypothetical protein